MGEKSKQLKMNGITDNESWKKTNRRIDHRELFWQQGEPLTEEDIRLLQPVKQFYIDHGYSPTKTKISNYRELRNRFRIWKDVLSACGLPMLTDPEQVRIRAEVAEKSRGCTNIIAGETPEHECGTV